MKILKMLKYGWLYKYSQIKYIFTILIETFLKIYYKINALITI